MLSTRSSSFRGRRALSRLITRFLCSPNIFLKVRSAFGSKYFAIILSFEFCDKDTIFFAKLFIFVLPFINTNEELAKRSLCHDAVDALSCP